MRALTLFLSCCMPLLTAHALSHPGAEDKLAYLDQRLAENPDEQQLYIQRGSTYSNHGQFAKALADLRSAEVLGEPLAVAFQLGVLHYRMNKFERARDYFDSWLLHSPRHAQALEYRARLLRDAREYQASLSDYRALFSLQKRTAPGNYIAAAKMLAQLDEEGTAAAIAMLDRGMQQLGLVPQLQRHAIKFELQQKQTAKAIARLATLQPMLGNSPEWKTDMGELLLLAGKNAQAWQLLTAATAQLGTLRKTPARIQLLQRLEELNQPGGNI